MAGEPAALAPAPDAALPPGFAPLVARLDALSRQHPLYFRIEVGRAAREERYPCDVEALPDTSPTKETSLRAFTRERRDRHAELALNEAPLRQAIEAHLVVAQLPAEVVRQLRFTHAVYLSQVADPATRRLLAGAAVDNAQSGAQLREASERARAGLGIVGKPAEPSLPPSGGDAPAARPGGHPRGGGRPRLRRGHRGLVRPAGRGPLDPAARARGITWLLRPLHNGERDAQ